MIQLGPTVYELSSEWLYGVKYFRMLGNPQYYVAYQLQGQVAAGFDMNCTLAEAVLGKAFNSPPNQRYRPYLGLVRMSVSFELLRPPR